jgi:hypothetical protein
MSICGEWKVTDIPSNKVDGVVQGFQMDGPLKVQKVAQADGRWTVIATFPPCAPGSSAPPARSFST